MKPLTARELQVFGHLGRGRTRRQIAADLGITVHTVDKHMAGISEKLGCSGQHGLRMRAIEERVRAELGQ